MLTIKNQYIYIFGFISIICASCSEGSFTKIVDVPIEESESLLTVIANLNNTDEDQYILVSKTLSVLDNAEFESLSNATVNLTTPDEGIKSLPFDQDANLYTLAEYEFKGGETYSLEVDHPDHIPMQAEITVPQSPEVIDMTVDLNENFGFDNFDPDVITIKFKDPGNEVNTYQFVGRMYSIDSETQDTFENGYYFDLSNNILEYNDDVISDITFNGREYELILLGNRSFFTDSPNVSLHRIEVDVISITEEFFLYDNSVSQAQDASDNPFVEPSTIYSNFDNGFGIFTINNLSTITHDL